MKKVARLALVLLLMVSMLYGYNVNASAASTKSGDGLEVTIVTDKDEYSQMDDVKVEISVKNTNNYAVEDVSVETILPKGLVLKEGSDVNETLDIEAGETKKVSVAVQYSEDVSDDKDDNKGNSDEPGNTGNTGNSGESDIPQAGDNSNAAIWVALIVASMAAVLFLAKSKKAKKGCALLLSAVMLMNMIPTDAFATEMVEKVISVDKEIKVAEKAYTIGAKVKYEVEGESKVNYTVEFDSNGGSEVESVVVQGGSFITAPSAPEMEGYSFAGWYVDNGTFEQKFDFLVPVNQNYKLYAKWVEIGEASGSFTSVDVYNITELVVDAANGKVIATVSAPENCAIVVRFIEEEVYFSADFATNKRYINDGLTFASHVVEAGSDAVEIECAINGELPEHFVAEAILIDGNVSSLCDPFSNIENTTRFQQFMDKTVNDFEGEEVLNFDEAEDMNFGVLADDVKNLTAEVVIYDEEADTYVVVSPSEEIACGDKIYVSDEAGQYIFKVAEVQVEDGLYTVVPANSEDEELGFNLSDFYQFLKVDMECSGGVESGEPEQQTYGLRSIPDADIDVNPEVKLTLDLISFETDHFKASGSVEGEFECDLVIYYDLKIFGEDYFKCNFTFTKDITADLSVVAKAGSDHDDYLESQKEEKEIKLGKVSIPFGVVGLSAFTEVNVLIEWEVTAGFEVTGHIKTTQGFKYNTKDGKQKVEEKESDWSVNCKGTAEVSFGPKPSIGIDFLGGVLSISLEGFLGAKFEGEAVVPIHQGGDEIHGCNLCVKGELKFVLSADLKFEYNIANILKGTPFDLELVNLEKKLFDFYVSLINSEDSMFEGHIKADRGECPNKMYKLNVLTYEANGQEIETDVNIYVGSTLKKTAKSGEDIYLKKGLYIAEATINGSQQKVAFNIAEQAKTVKIYGVENSSDENEGEENEGEETVESFISGNVIDATSRNPIVDANITVYEGSVHIADAKTDANGKYKINLNQGTYNVTISADGYREASQTVTVGYGEDKYLDSLLMATYNADSIMGGIYGCIRDAVTGEALSDVKIDIIAGWSDVMDGTGEIVASNITDSYGEYDNRKWTEYGVDFGLTAGNYTLVISKEGYIPTSFNITVVGGEDMQFNSTITPVGSDDVYRIVLTWGETPRDLDSHLNATYNEAREHVYFAWDIGFGSDLDVDDIDSYGPETITIPDISLYTGNVMYSVHDYTNRYSEESMELSTSGATVKVYKGAEIIQVFYVPAGELGTVWNVFYIDANGNVVSVNTFEYEETPSDVMGSAN